MLRNAAGILVAVATAVTPIAAQAAESVRASSAVVAKRTVTATPPIAFARSSAELKDENSLIGSPALYVVLLLMAGAVGLGLAEVIREDRDQRSPN